jgi:hypothetical protein
VIRKSPEPKAQPTNLLFGGSQSKGADLDEPTALARQRAQEEQALSIMRIRQSEEENQ